MRWVEISPKKCLNQFSWPQPLSVWQVIRIMKKVAKLTKRYKMITKYTKRLYKKIIVCKNIKKVSLKSFLKVIKKVCKKQPYQMLSKIFQNQNCNKLTLGWRGGGTISRDCKPLSRKKGKKWPLPFFSAMTLSVEERWWCLIAF